MLESICAGRTDRIWDWLAAGGSAEACDAQGTSLLNWCAYYGDVSAMRHLLAHGAPLPSLGENLGLHAAAFHGHWPLCAFLIEQGARVAHRDPENGETVLHAAVSGSRLEHQLQVLRVLLAAGADVQAVTQGNAPTGSFMRDCRTRAETALHRAALASPESVIDTLLTAGADKTARDAHGDSALSWASWARRPDAVLRKLCFDGFRIHPARQPLSASLLGEAQV